MQNNEGLENEDSTKKHWENIFSTKNFNEVSWYQENPKTSVDLILSVNSNKDANIIDVGAGDSNLPDKLIELGFKNITILDISLRALEKSKQRLGKISGKINWICSDIRDFETDNRFDIWHDRALFHFLKSEEDIKKYLESVKKFLKQGGYLIIATFSLKGPNKCSGLDIKQYSEDSMKKLFDNGYEYIISLEETHHTPFKTSQGFIWNVLKKLM